MQNETRSVFARQPAHILLVDYQHPFDCDTCEYLQQSLVDLFSLVCNLAGPCRTPLFGLFVLGSYPDNLFPLQHVKNNFPRLHSAFEELKFFTKDTKQLPDSKTTDILLQGMQDGITQFKRQAHSFRQINSTGSQMEFCIFTCRKAKNLTRKIEEISKNLELGSIKKIQIAAVVNNVADQDVQDDDNSKEQETSPPSSTETGITGCGIVDTITLQKDPTSFQNFFKTWLLDCETDQEHIRIELPINPCTDIQNEEDSILDVLQDTTLILKCDLHERLISPSFLPYRSQFEVNAECVPNNKPWPGNSKQNGIIAYPIHTMTMDRLDIKREAICESVPYIIRPTVCWKLDWEELEHNQQYFHALCHALQERDLVILLRTKPTSNPKQAQQPGVPLGHFIVLPSHGNTMLLKSIATNELMLPVDLNQSMEGPTTEASEIISACLDQLRIEDTYNPLLVSSNLHKCLSSNALKGNKGNIPQRSVKRGFQVPQRYQQENNLGRISEPRPPHPKPTRTPAAPKRVIFSKDGNVNKTASIKRSRVTPALDIYISSPTDFADEL